MKRDQVRFYTSFEEENEAEYQRRARMTPQERMQEFALLQKRQWGSKWTSERLVRKAWWERVAWDR